MKPEDCPGLFAWTLRVYFLLFGGGLASLEYGAVLFESHLVLRWDIFIIGDPSAGVRLFLNFVVLACIINVMLNIKLPCDRNTQFDGTFGLARPFIQVRRSGIRCDRHLCVNDAVRRLIQKAVYVELLLLYLDRFANIRVRLAADSVYNAIISNHECL